MPCITAFCDASFDHVTKAAGWGVWIKGPNGTFMKGYVFKADMKNAADAEQAAATNTLSLVKLLYPDAGRDWIVVLQSDCLRVKHALDGMKAEKRVWTPIEDRLRAVAADLKKQGLAIRFKHVKGHQGSITPRNHVNEMLDGMAKAAMRKRRSELSVARPRLL